MQHNEPAALPAARVQELECPARPGAEEEAILDTRVVGLEVELPVDVAELLERAIELDPSFLRRVLVYGLMRREVYEHLAASSHG